MTWEEALNQSAKNNGWATYKEFIDSESPTYIVNVLCKQAAELYAKAKWEEACEAQQQIINFWFYGKIDEKKLKECPKPEFKP